MTPSRDAEGEAGFTLVEVLVTLALVSVLATTIAVTASQFGSLLRIERQMETRLALQRVVGHMARLLEDVHDAAALARQQENGGPISITLKGTANEVQFATLARRGAYRHGFRNVTLRLEGAARNLAVFQEMAPRRRGGVPLDQVERIELARDATALEFSYYGLREDSASATWNEQWSNSGLLPIAVSISLSVVRNDRVVTVTEIARLGPR